MHPITIRHWLPGRIRYHVPALRSKAALGKRLEKRLAALEGVLTARANTACAGFVVDYDAGVCSPAVIKARLHEGLQEGAAART